MQPPTTKKELQRLIGKINFVRRFISNLSGRIEPFMALVKIKSDDEFHWGAEQQRAFDEIKRYLTTPPVLVPPQQDRPFYIYLSVADTSIASVVVQLYEGVEKVVFYLSRRMLDAETRYPEVEKLCLCLFFTCTKLHHILLTAEIIVICKSDVVKHMLSAPVLKGRLDATLRAVAALVVAIGALVGAAAGGLLVAAPVALIGGLLIFIIVVVVVVGPGAEALRRRVILEGVVVSSSPLPRRKYSGIPGENESSSLSDSSSPSARNWRSSSPLVKDLSSSDQTEEAWSSWSHSSGARSSCAAIRAAIGSHSGVGSREEEEEEKDWEERSDEAEEEEEEDIALRLGFLGADGQNRARG
ncbi:hypothetical protein QYE76_025900 [Lolium multiflorum]|uniref:Reverse transcriptase/retrotransposon-derived protein RNase H-like domain-containing protein n=1 Tax=Lolium multiflorum TaxID=4521 RepID=A0AAD8RJH2_LOLMU|nr:hypothetical protein QYE76_025900 [Lolium multiflorum]